VAQPLGYADKDEQAGFDPTKLIDVPPPHARVPGAAGGG